MTSEFANAGFRQAFSWLTLFAFVPRRGPQWQGSTLFQALHRGLDASCYSTDRVSLTRGEYSSVTQATHVRLGSSDFVRCSQMRRSLTLNIPRQAVLRANLEPS
jgi:hypothetical protein